MNIWAFTGNLGKDAETRFTQSGDPIVSFSVGVKSGYGDKATTTWANCSMFGKRGEAVAPYLTKGALVGINGEVNLRAWNDKDGNKRQNLDVRVNDLTLLGGRQSSESPESKQPAQQPAKSGSSFEDMEDGIPF